MSAWRRRGGRSSTESLDGVKGDLRGLLSSVEDDAGALLGVGLAVVARLGDRINVRSTSAGSGVHVRELALHQLEATDGLAKLVTFVHVRQHHIKRRLHQASRRQDIASAIQLPYVCHSTSLPKRSSSEYETLVIEARHQHVHALAHLTEHVLIWYFAVLEEKLSPENGQTRSAEALPLHGKNELTSHVFEPRIPSLSSFWAVEKPG